VHGGDGGGEPPPVHHEAGEPARVRGAPVRATSVAQLEDAVALVAQRGRAGAGQRVARGEEPGPAIREPTPEEIQLQQIQRRHEQLGDEPPKFEIRANDDVHGGDGAHTIDRHGPHIPLPRQPGVKTVEGRIFGETGWRKAESRSYKWTDPSTMNREVNRYVRENWARIRDDLAFDERHDGLFDAGHRVGQGYYNKGMYGAGPRAAEYGETSLVRVRIQVVEGSDPAVPFIVTAFPAGLG
jgi:hypothetical protein